jgi:hypothetical protein
VAAILNTLHCSSVQSYTSLKTGGDKGTNETEKKSALTRIERGRRCTAPAFVFRAYLRFFRDDRLTSRLIEFTSYDEKTWGLGGRCSHQRGHGHP